MRSPINTFPRGLLGLLGVQTGGKVPLELEPSVRSTFEMFQLYALSKAEIIGDSTLTVTAVLGPYLNSFARLTVPQGELWYVHDYTAESALPLAAGESHAICPIVNIPAPITAPNPNFMLNQDDSFTAGTLALLRAVGPFWMPAGARLGVFLTNIVASSSTISYSLRARVTRIEV